MITKDAENRFFSADFGVNKNLHLIIHFMPNKRYYFGKPFDAEKINISKIIFSLSNIYSAITRKHLVKSVFLVTNDFLLLYPFLRRIPRSLCILWSIFRFAWFHPRRPSRRQAGSEDNGLFFEATVVWIFSFWDLRAGRGLLTGFGSYGICPVLAEF